MPFATIIELELLWRKLSLEEKPRATELLKVVSNMLRVEAKKVNRNLDAMAQDPEFKDVLKSVIVDVVGRTLMTSTDKEPMIQSSESALGYSASGTFLVPGGGIFIKNSELARLGLKKQRFGGIDIYGIDKRDANNTPEQE